MTSQIPSTDTFHWLCPACQTPLRQQGPTLICSNQHHYDRAKQGYVNLHLVQHKKSKHPGDSAEMVSARRTFLSQGHYHPLAVKLSQILEQHHQSAQVNIFDAGCGEGYYLSTLNELLSTRFPRATYAGIDVAKTAIAKAAKRLPQSHFAVASTYAMPIPQQSQSAVLQIFAPASASEVYRVLCNDGIWITVNPAPEHLYELKKCVYDTPAKHVIDNTCPDGFELLDNEQLYFAIDLQKHDNAREALLQMTPFYWSISEEKRAKLREQLEHVHAHFHINVWAKVAQP